MGGAGAKNRRRLQRQPDDTQLGYNEGKKKEKEKEKGQSIATKKSQDTKFKKPKHLKRKLEAIAANEGDRERVLQTMQQWQREKSTYQQTGEKTKKKKVAVKKGAAKPTVLEDSDNFTTSRRHAETAAFPRRDTDSAAYASTQQPRGMVSEAESRTDKLSTIIFAVESANRKQEEESDDGSDVEAEPQRRERGKRRRGRKTAEKQTESDESCSRQLNFSNDSDEQKKESTGPESTQVAHNHANNSTDNKISDNKRYCIGRKPVTDFVVGEKYEGRVVYVKPFGLFLDIGCHSDAFCHVSRLSDAFVEDPGVMFNEGDSVSARVVEIDRKKKRITVSLQSDAKIADEEASTKAHLERQLKHRKHKPPKDEIEPLEKGSKDNERKPEGLQKFERADIATKPEAQMNPSELKRARKLERRAARRSENQPTESQ